MRTHPTGESRESGGELNFRTCPAGCGKEWKTYLNPETGQWICFYCDARGRADVGITKGALLDMLERGQRGHEWREVRLPDYKPLSRAALRYLAGRGIDKPNKYGLRELVDSRRILIPYFGDKGKIIYWNTRAYVPDGEAKYMAAPGKHPLYVLPDYRAHANVTIVEGVFDAIAVHEATGGAAIALGGKTLPRYLKADLSAMCSNKVTIMLDGDAFADSLKLKAQIPWAKVEFLPRDQDPEEFYRAQG